MSERVLCLLDLGYGIFSFRRQSNGITSGTFWCVDQSALANFGVAGCQRGCCVCLTLGMVYSHSGGRVMELRAEHFGVLIKMRWRILGLQDVREGAVFA